MLRPIAHLIHLFFLLEVLSSCASRTSGEKRYPRQTFEGTISLGAPFFTFTPDHTKDTFFPETSDSILKEINHYLLAQPPHHDRMSESLDAQSAHIKFYGQRFSRPDGPNMHIEEYIRIYKIINISPASPDYIQWRADR